MPHPPLHDLVTVVAAPCAVVSDAQGDLAAVAAHGVYVSDRRMLSIMTVSTGEHTLVPLGCVHVQGGNARFASVVAGAGDPIPDPTVTIERVRTATPTGLVDRISVISAAGAPVVLTLTVTLGTDLAPMVDVREDRRLPLAHPMSTLDGVRWTDADGSTVAVTADPDPHVDIDVEARTARMTWTLALEPRETRSVEVHVAAEIEHRGPASFRPAVTVPWSTPRARADDGRLTALIDTGMADLQGLLLRDGDDHVLAAGSPWFLTLFGRDSIWAARFLLPLGTDLALGTLRALARRAGTRHQADSAEQPGRILHEVRPETLTLGGLALPPVYYGSVDSTPLWICLLVDAWRWGADPAEIESLLPTLEGALAWMRDFGDADGDGFLEYIDHSGRGLGNQGWKDSFDSVQWADGRLADPPIALSEVQAYAYEAATGAAALLEAFGRDGADEWRAWAERLATEFRRQFWTEDDLGPYPGIALDRDKALVDGVASNMGHLLGTGLLQPEEVDAVARRLTSPDLDSGFGLRTLTSRSPRFSPLSYHGGAVWPHDTAIAIRGLAAEGKQREAADLMRGLLAAGTVFDSRLPELYGVGPAGPHARPYPYPPACRPQAWAAASAVAMLAAAVGLTPDVPRGTIQVHPMTPSPVGWLDVRGLRVAGQDVDLLVSADGELIRWRGFPHRRPSALTLSGYNRAISPPSTTRTWPAT